MKSWSTVSDFVQFGKTRTVDSTVYFKGFDSPADGGGSIWVKTGETGTPSELPTIRGDNKITDKDGVVYEVGTGEIFYFNGSDQWFPSPFGDSGIGLYQYNGGSWDYYDNSIFLQTTESLISSSTPYPAGAVLTFVGYATPGDGGAAQWKATSTTGLTASQSPVDRSNGELVDATGRLWELVDDSVSARAFGLFGPGDETGALQAVANWLNPDRKAFFVDDFTITSTVTFNNGGTVDFGSVNIDGTGLPNSTTNRDLNIAMLFTGSANPSASIDANIAEGDDTFTSAGASGISVGDTVIVRSDQLFDDAWDGSTAAKRGEVLTIKSVSGSTYGVSEGFKFSYLASSGLVVEKVNTVTPKVSGGKLTMGGVGSEHRGMFFEYCRDVEVFNTEVVGAEDTCIQLSRVHTADVKAICRDATKPSSGFNTGYGVASVNGSRNIDIDVIGYNCKHVVTAGGELPSLETRVKGIAYDSGIDNSAFDCHEPCYDWTWDVECYNCFGGIVIRGNEQRVRIKTRNMASRSVTVKTFNTVTSQRDIDVELESDTGGSGCVIIESDLQDMNEISLKARIKDITGVPVNLIGNATYSINNLTLDLDLDGTDNHSITGSYVNEINGRVRSRNSGQDAIEFLNCSKIALEVDSIATAGDAVYLENTNDVALSGERCESSSNYGVFTSSCSNVRVGVANLIASNTNFDGWRAVDTIGGKLIGATITSDRHGVFSSGTSDRFVIVGNDAVDVFSGTKYNLAGANNSTSGNIS